MINEQKVSVFRFRDQRVFLTPDTRHLTPDTGHPTPDTHNPRHLSSCFSARGVLQDSPIAMVIGVTRQASIRRTFDS